MAGVDELVSHTSGAVSMGHLASMGPPARPSSSNRSQAVVRGGRIRPSEPDFGEFGDLESSTVAVHAPHRRARLNSDGTHWHYGGKRMGGSLLPAAGRHSLATRAGVAGLAKFGASCVQHVGSDGDPFGPVRQGDRPMSAPAPALAKVERSIVIVRLADSAEVVAALSFVFGLLLIVFPVSFPRLIVNSWQHGQLMISMMVFTFLLDTILYLRIAHIRAAKPGAVAAACLGSLPLLVVGGLSLLLQSAVRHTLAVDLPNLQARVGEEVLAHTYLGLVSAIFLPFLVVRLLQQFKSTNS